MRKNLRLARFLLALFASSIGTVAVAQQPAEQEYQWWFDVEVILFDRNLSFTDSKEQFVEDPNLSPTNATWDLITKTRKPDVSWILQGLKPCQTPVNFTYISAEEAYPLPELPDIPQVSTPFEIDDTAVFNHLGMPSAAPLTVDPETANAPDNAMLEQSTYAELEQQDPISNWLANNAPDLIRPIPLSFEAPATTCFDREQLFHDTTSYPLLESLPVEISGPSGNETWGENLLNKADFGLADLSKRIRQEPSLTRLLHVAWRQQVAFGRENAASVRLYGGKNYAQTFTLAGNQRVVYSESSLNDETLSLADTIELAFNDDSALSTESILARMTQTEQPESDLQETPYIWQIDGAMKVFLQYVNRVPYLHIDADVHYRQPVPVVGSTKAEMRLASIPFEQQRRVISKQIHYFDHPMFGMIVEIRRFKKL